MPAAIQLENPLFFGTFSLSNWFLFVVEASYGCQDNLETKPRLRVFLASRVKMSTTMFKIRGDPRKALVEYLFNFHQEFVDLRINRPN